MYVYLITGAIYFMYDIENSTGFLLAKAYQRGLALFSEELAPYGLTPPQFSVLAFLWQKEGMTQTEIAEKAQIDRATMGGMIDRLERMQLLRRDRHPKDRRAYLIYLGLKGKELETELSAVANAALEKFTSGLAPNEKNELSRLLGILRGNRRIYEKTAA